MMTLTYRYNEIRNEVYVVVQSPAKLHWVAGPFVNVPLKTSEIFSLPWREPSEDLARSLVLEDLDWIELGPERCWTGEKDWLNILEE